MILKGQLHTHTSMSDGKLTPQEVANEYSRLGFHFLAFTDHDHLLRPSYWDEIQKVRSNLFIFSGIELTVHCSKGYVHVNKIEARDEIIHIFNHPADCDLTVRETIGCVKEVAEKYPIDAIEITNHGFYTPQFDILEIPYLKIAADDSHNRMGCGRGWIEVEMGNDITHDTILKTIKSGKYRNCFTGKKSQKNNITGGTQDLRFS